MLQILLGHPRFYGNPLDVFYSLCFVHFPYGVSRGSFVDARRHSLKQQGADHLGGGVCHGTQHWVADLDEPRRRVIVDIFT